MSNALDDLLAFVDNAIKKSVEEQKAIGQQDDEPEAPEENETSEVNIPSGYIALNTIKLNVITHPTKPEPKKEEPCQFDFGV